ncbi:MAG: hypothetical protein SFY56_08765 [Bacteroidota bacterium]|nr:hypothetical protein [Bacteroidota bacterium]
MKALEDIAMQKLLIGQEIDASCHYILLNVDPTFTNKFTLQFEILQKQVNWYRTTSLSDTDRQNIYGEVLESELPEPSILDENGSIPKENFEGILKIVKNITLPPFVDEEWGSIRDGEIYTLTIGYKGCVASYKWHYLPKSWEILQNIVNDILRLNSTLTSLIN